jgi:hypothetical protein
MPRILIPLCLLTLLTGCVDKEAREYAATLSALLTSYQSDIRKRIQTEERFYRDSANDFREEADTDVNRSLSLERDERSRELLAELQEKGRPPSTAFLQQRLRDYGNMDFDASRKVLERETSAQADFLAGLHDLDGHAKSIGALNKAVKDLAKAPSTLDQLKQLQVFVTGVKTEIDRMDCDDIKKSLAAAADERKSLDASVKLLGPTPALRETNKAQIDRLTARIGEIDTNAAALTSQRLTRGCPN